MKTGNIVKKGLRVIALLLVLIVIGITLFLYQTLPQRDGELNIPGLKEKVEVIYDAWGVPHIYASNEEDAYRALGYVHAQDRLFQMEMTRRLAKGELAEVLGKKLLKTDKFFRTLWIKGFAKEYVKTIPGDNKALVLSKIYLEGVNHFLETGPTPIEFHLIGIPKKPFTLEDSFAIGGYISYSFASAFKTDPLLSYIKETYGAAYLKDLGYYSAKETIPGAGMHAGNYETLADLGLLAVEIEETTSPIGMFEGSNAWVISGSKTKSGKPILASDPHVKFSIPSVWYEAHVWAPGFELYGHYLAGVPMAMLGHNRHMGWGITMFKNDDINFFTEKVNPENPGEVWQNGKWEKLAVEKERIVVKGGEDVVFDLRRSSHGPIMNDVVKGFEKRKKPISMWWAYHEKSNRLLDVFYHFGRAKTVKDLEKAAPFLHAPGVNIIAADSEGNIGWWGLGKVPELPAHADSNFILQSGADEYRGFFDFSRQPQAVNPASGMIVSCNHKAEFKKGNEVPGYYNMPFRALRIEEMLNQKKSGWTAEDMKAIQMDNTSRFHEKIREQVVPVLEADAALMKNANAVKALEIFKNWQGEHAKRSTGPTIFFQYYYDLMELAFKDELGDKFFKLFLKTKAFENTIPRIAANMKSPWWDNIKTAEKETAKDIIAASWMKMVTVLEKDLGSDPGKWYWEKVHTLEHVHPIGRKKPMNLIFNVGPFSLGGARETINNLGGKITGGHHAVSYGPSTRRIIDFGDPENSFGVSPVGQSGYFFDDYYDDQAEMFAKGEYRKQLINRKEIQEKAKSRLLLKP